MTTTGIEILETLKSDALEDLIACITNTHACFARLSRSDEVKHVRTSLALKKISDEDITKFTNDLMVDFERGVFFVHDIALSALAVALVDSDTEGSNEYLTQLSGAMVAEVSRSRRIAEVCLEVKNSRNSDSEKL